MNHIFLKKQNKNNNGGYALYFAIILTGLLLLVSYATANISIKELLLSGFASDSHLAFYNTDSGLECAMYWDLKNPGGLSAFDPSSPVASITCNGATIPVTTVGGGGGSSVNVAQGKTASQSSTYDGITGAANAVDGNTNGNYASGSLTHTNYDETGWWQVDLGSSYSISSVVVWNRTDCCKPRLTDYWIYISNTPGGTDYSYHQTSYPNPSSTVSTPGASGRYVKVQLSGSSSNFDSGVYVLSLAEVQVFNTVSSGGSSSTFQINHSSGCSTVKVTKNAGGTTLIESRGYNTCSGSRRLERGVKIQY